VHPRNDELSRYFPENFAVLTMTWLMGTGRFLQLEGELLEPWVETVRDACTQRGRRSKGFRLDLAAVTYVDAAGAQLLRELMRESIAIAACSSFVAELLHLEDT
jgi:ABC-type transporter Mla MlaB component